MSRQHAAVVLRTIRSLNHDRGHEVSDAELLRQFADDRDQSAYETIIRRYYGMVYCVCRAVLHHPQDAEDTTQAVFLVLARQAGSIRKQDSLGSWLHGVAYRTALKLRRKRKPLPVRELEPTAAVEPNELSLRESIAILHEELAKLAPGELTPLLLCYWEGLTRDEAATRLKLSPPTFRKRLERARGKLKQSLDRRGMTFPALGFAGFVLSQTETQALPASVTTTLTNWAIAYRDHRGTEVVPHSVAAIAQGAVNTMKISQWINIAVVTLMGVTTAGLGYYGVAHANGPELAQSEPKPKQSTPAPQKPLHPSHPKEIKPEQIDLQLQAADKRLNLEKRLSNLQAIRKALYSEHAELKEKLLANEDLKSQLAAYRAEITKLDIQKIVVDTKLKTYKLIMQTKSDQSTINQLILAELPEYKDIDHANIEKALDIRMNSIIMQMETYSVKAENCLSQLRKFSRDESTLKEIAVRESQINEQISRIERSLSELGE